MYRKGYTTYISEIIIRLIFTDRDLEIALKQYWKTAEDTWI